MVGGSGNEIDPIDKYWEKYHWAIPYAEAEDKTNPIPATPYRQYLPTDPSHPRAFIPNYVRWAKRYLAGFRCLITGWHETDYFQDIDGRGPIRLVGRLTADHKLPGSLGGLTTDENIQMISCFANTKKGNSGITNEELTERLLKTHKKLELPEDLKQSLQKYNITIYRVGNATLRFR